MNPSDLDDVTAALNSDTFTPSAKITTEVTDRENIGGSSIGHPCERSVALRLRGFPVDVRAPSKDRILKMGHLLEGEIIGEVQKALDTLVGKTFRLTHLGDLSVQFHVEHGTLVSAYADGVVELVEDGSPVSIIEAKTANHASFLQTKRIGVRYAHQEYYDQMQLIMGLGKIESALFIMINKNNSEIYAETVDYDEITFNYLIARAEFIAEGGDEKCAKTPSDFRCSLCNYKQVCWFNEPIKEEQRTCRHCVHSIVTDGFYIECVNPKGIIGDIPMTTKNSAHAWCFRCPEFKDYRTKDLKS